MATEAVDNNRATVRVCADVSGGLGTDGKVDEIACVFRKRRVSDLMSNTGVGRTGNTISGSYVIYLIAVPKYTLPF
jgi:hypothetical protein